MENKLFSRFYFWFEAKHSFIDALTAIVKDITKSLNGNQKSVLITFDMKKAFDCVNQTILL